MSFIIFAFCLLGIALALVFAVDTWKISTRSVIKTCGFRPLFAVLLCAGAVYFVSFLAFLFFAKKIGIQMATE